ncbi:MAG: AAA family ATPase, partial [Betaproteobacteria bacterium]|nr:AAA family ATPase [Betaproteobacteria bacterium]
LKGQVDTLSEKLIDIKSISFFSLRDVDKVQQRISHLRISLGALPHLNSADTKLIVDDINESLDSVLNKAGKLQGEINKQKKSIEATIKKHKQGINDFLRYAGYKYIVDIQPDADSYKMKLKHLDFHENIENGGMHLSFGERNAFSIVLFMYECLTRTPDLVILDDPVSSFDKNKKFAILEILFRGNESLRGKTVLMLTHDIEPIIDLLKSLGHIFQPAPVAYFLKMRSGLLSEIPITKKDVSSFSQICEENIKNLADDIVKTIYLRRHYEIANDKGLEYQLLSNLLHKRAQPVVREGDTERNMTAEEIAEGTKSIRVKLQSFDYTQLQSRVVDRTAMIKTYQAAENNYEKLQLFRLVSDENHENDVVRKYINETFHIENEYIMQLNPHKYDFIPEHIIAECDRSLGFP